MCERYTAEAKRAIFFAQYEASRANSLSVETEHLLLGMLRESPAFFERFQITETSIRNLIYTDEAFRRGASVDLSNVPLTDESKNVLSSAKNEADRMSSKHIGIEHLLLGLLLHENCAAAKILHKCGASLDRIRAELDAAPHHPPSEEARANRANDELDSIIKSVSDQFYLGAGKVCGLTDRLSNFTEKARRAIFFARYEASQFRSPTVETYQLLLGVVREGLPRADLFMPSAASQKPLRIQIEEYAAVREKVVVSPGLPFSEECERALANAEEDAAKPKHKHVGLEHLLLGMLREEGSVAARLLRERGGDIERIRRGLVGHDPGEDSQPR
jgi:ATP-dependent Clp protease ATP-binding subunit ClpA